jgi:putative IMPACT (imprinted ancient) family translation regulator
MDQRPKIVNILNDAAAKSSHADFEVLAWLEKSKSGNLCN